MEITAEYARSVLSYDPETGILTWLVNSSRNVKAGRVAGSGCGMGYIAVTINKKPYLAHRLAWLIHYGSWPDNVIDHINGVRTDNRIVNLRDCTNQENLFNTKTYSNSSTGIKGVSWNAKAKKWQTSVKFNYKTYHFGMFDDINDAASAVKSGRERLHGEFANHGDQNNVND